MSVPVPPIRHSFLERAIEQTIFASRWLMAPFYLGLIVALVLLLVEFARRAFDLVSDSLSVQQANIIIGILSLIDLSLMANLVIMVMFAGYENFVSKLDIDAHKDRPDWMGHVGFGDLKLKLMTSIVAISAIHVLEAFMNLDHLDNRTLAWTVGIHMTFIVSGILLAIMERISKK
jgi:uncharacterized protein (TIGR00645 family)